MDYRGEKMFSKLKFSRILLAGAVIAVFFACFTFNSLALASDGLEMKVLGCDDGEAMLQEATSVKGATTNVELGAGIVGTKKFTINQKNVRDTALARVVYWRRDALGDSNIKFDGKTVKEYLSANNISESTYLNPSWSNALERIAVQRAIEAGDSTLGHTRPNGSSWSTATYNNISSNAEILAWGSGYTYTGATAVDQWASEKADYVKECKEDESHGETGHYITLVNPAYNAYGFALAAGYNYENVAAGEASTKLQGSSDATNWAGTYSFDMSISDTLAESTGVNVNLFARVARINIGESYTFSGTLAYRNNTFAIKDKWYSSSPDILKVEASGQAKALTSGTSYVYVLGQDVRIGITITVPELREMYRLYNKWTGEHFYSASATERDNICAAGWSYESVGWLAPTSSKTKVYRLYNKYAGDHHFTMDENEYNSLEKLGWTKEGVGWYSDDAKGVKVYREYNPYAVTGTHNYTTSATEHSGLLKKGWKEEGTAWWGLKETTTS